MPAARLIAAGALAALGLAGCNNPEARSAANSRICTPFSEAAATAAPTTAADPAAGLDDCLHRWAYTLASSTDRAPDVAQATVAACTPALTRWNQAGLTSGAPGQPPAPAQSAPSLLTGQPTTPIGEHYAYAQGRALFYVVQARAGKCAPPPAAATNTTATR